MTCRCAERRDAITGAVRAALAGDVSALRSAATTVQRTLREDAEALARVLATRARRPGPPRA